MNVHTAFYRYKSYDGVSDTWYGTSNSEQIFGLSDDDVRFVQTAEELLALFQDEFPCHDPNLTRVISDGNSVTVYNQAMVRIAGTPTEADLAKILAAARGAGKLGVAVALRYGYDKPVVPGIVWRSRAGQTYAIYDPKKAKIKAEKVMASPIVMTEVDRASYDLIDELIPVVTGEFGQIVGIAGDWLYPIRYAILQGDCSTTLVAACRRFVGRVAMMEKLFGTKKVVKTKAIKAVLDRWRASPVANGEKFRTYGQDGTWLAEWFEKQLKIKVPAPALEPVGAAS